MPIAAIPAYLGKDFKDASPGLKFGLLLSIWTNRQDQETEVKKRAQAKSWVGQQVSELLNNQGMDATIDQLTRQQSNPLPGLWAKNDFAAHAAWQEITAIPTAAQTCMRALVARQQALANQGTHLLCLDAVAVAPFTTGLGNEHPLENGFSFLNPYGLPYLPGSGIKGVVRQAARELASGAWGDTHGWDATIPSPLTKKLGLGEGLSVTDLLFGREARAGENEHLQGALSFWDAIPQLPPADPRKPGQISLQVEIMTPHQGHYYQQKSAMGSSMPHDSGSPIPISFLTLPPGTRFAFHVQCDLNRLTRLAPELNQGDRWRALIQAAFDHAFAWLGFGAKTAVGYGQMREDRGAKHQREEALRQAQADAEAARVEAERQTRLANMTPEEKTLAKIRSILEKDKKTQQRQAGGELTHTLTQAMKEAQAAWKGPVCVQLADLAEEVYGYVGWGNGDRKRERKALIQAIRERA